MDLKTPEPARARPAPLTPAGNGNPDPAGFGVYIHWPFCAAKCPYCDFNSHVRHARVDQAAFARAFETDIRRWRAAIGPRHITSVFFGGGTPSLMSQDTAARIIDAIAEAWHLDPDAEVTLEANPTSVEATRFRGYRQAGINRVSLGVQSLRDEQLKALGRLHTADEARAAVLLAQEIFSRTTFDLIYARPNQSVEDWAEELSAALALSAGHLSLYQLTIESGTPFADLHAAGRLIVPDPDHADALYTCTRAMTAEAGLPVYEISNHARPGDESRHNLLYWRYGEYVGIGPGAHGRVIADGDRLATAAVRHPETWRDAVLAGGDALVERTPLTRSEQADELLLMGLRLVEGVDLARLAAIGGVSPDARTVAELVDGGWLAEPAPGRLAATDQGRFMVNRLALELSSSFEAVSPAPPPARHHP